MAIDYTAGKDTSLTRVRLSANTAGTATATVDPIEFDVETFDDDDWHDNVTNPSRVTVTEAGKYRVKGSIEYATNATGIRQARIHINGTFKTYGIMPAMSSGNTVVDVSDTFELAANDYIELAAYQTSGGGLIIRGGDGLATFLIVERVSLG